MRVEGDLDVDVEITQATDIVIDQSDPVYQVNLLTNSGFGVISNSEDLYNQGSQISVTDISSGVCTTADTEGLVVGELVEFGAGGTTENGCYEVTAVVTNTTFTINDTSITDATNVTCYEVVSGLEGANTLAFDGHSRTSGLKIYKTWGDTTHISNGYHGLKLIKAADGAEYYNLNTRTNETFLARVRGRTVTLGCYLYSVTAADNLKLQINDGVTDPTTNESTFVGADVKTWVEITQTISATATEFTPRILCDGDTSDVGYASPVMCVLGSSIGEGNYVAPPGEVVWLENTLNPSNWNNVAKTATSDATINTEAEFLGKIPKGIVAGSFRVLGSCNQAQRYLSISPTSALAATGVYLYIFVANEYRYTTGWTKCGNSGDVYVSLNGTTWAGVTIYLNAVQVAP